MVAGCVPIPSLTPSSDLDVEHESLLSPTSAAAPKAMPSVADPTNEGLSLARLKRVAAYVQRQVDEGKAPMMQLAIARRGKLCFTASAGLADRERNRPLTDRTIMRMYSNTKMVVSVAAMILVERAQLHLDWPVEAYLPCFKDVRVYERSAGDEVVTRAPTRKMTIQHLLTHTSGLTYGFMQGPVAAMYKAAGLTFDVPIDIGLGVGSGSAPDEPGALLGMVKRLAALPLMCTPLPARGHPPDERPLRVAPLTDARPWRAAASGRRPRHPVQLRPLDGRAGLRD